MTSLSEPAVNLAASVKELPRPSKS